MGRSHALLTGAAYLTLALHPIATPLGAIGAPRLIVAGGASQGAYIVVGMIVATACGLAPDLDRSGSTVARAGGVPTRLAAWLVQGALGHRGALHSLLAVLAVWWLGEAIGAVAGASGLGGVAAFGWSAHLLLDAWTARGVPLLWPMRRQLRLPPGFSTGGTIEYLIVVGLLMLCVSWAAA